jgi:hypothetical protein
MAANYRSGKLFRFLGNHIVNNHIHVKIHAERSEDGHLHAASRNHVSVGISYGIR